MSDRRPERVYGVLVREGSVFVCHATGGRYGLPGGAFPPLAEDRKVELAAHLRAQLGVVPARTWAQGAFDYHDPAEAEPAFCGFYTVWEWEGVVGDEGGRWLDKLDLMLVREMDQSLRILLYSVLDTVAMRTRP